MIGGPQPKIIIRVDDFKKSIKIDLVFQHYFIIFQFQNPARIVLIPETIIEVEGGLDPLLLQGRVFDHMQPLI